MQTTARTFRWGSRLLTVTTIVNNECLSNLHTYRL